MFVSKSDNVKMKVKKMIDVRSYQKSIVKKLSKIDDTFFGVEDTAINEVT